MTGKRQRAGGRERQTDRRRIREAGWQDREREVGQGEEGKTDRQGQRRRVGQGVKRDKAGKEAESHEKGHRVKHRQTDRDGPGDGTDKKRWRGEAQREKPGRKAEEKEQERCKRGECTRARKLGVAGRGGEERKGRKRRPREERGELCKNKNRNGSGYCRGGPAGLALSPGPLCSCPREAGPRWGEEESGRGIGLGGGWAAAPVAVGLLTAGKRRLASLPRPGQTPGLGRGQSAGGPSCHRTRPHSTEHRACLACS